MSDVKIISVHPAEKTLGALHPEVIERMKRVARFNVLSCRNERKLRSRLNFFFAVNGKMSRSISRKLVIIRIIAGLLVAGAPFIGFSGMLDPLSIVMISLGVLLAFGFMTRFVSLGIAAVMLYDFAMTFMPSSPDITLLFAALPYIGLALLGGGHHGLDALLRHRIYRRMARRREQRLAKIRMSCSIYSVCK